MLAHCTECGKPVFLAKGNCHLRCAYCGSEFSLPASVAGEKVETTDWRDPLYKAVLDRRFDPIASLRFLKLLDGYPFVTEITKEVTEKIVSSCQEYLNHSCSEEELQLYLSRLDGFDEQPDLAALLQQLREKYKQILIDSAERQIQYKCSELEKRITHSENTEQISSILQEISTLPLHPMVKKIQIAAEEKKQSILKKQAKEKAARIRKILLISTAILVFVIFLSYTMYDYNVSQPRKLEDARTAAADENYAEADSLYKSLEKFNLFKNQELSDAAAKERIALRYEWADSLAKKDNRNAAIEKFTALIEDYQSAGIWAMEKETRESFGSWLEKEDLLEEALEQYELIPDSKEKIKDLNTRLAIKYFNDGIFSKALDRYDLGNKNGIDQTMITALEIYRLQAAEKPKTIQEFEEMLRLYYTRAEEAGKEAIRVWELSGKDNSEEEMRKLAKAGRTFPTVDAQLAYWDQLVRAGADLTLVYPNGTEVKDLLLPLENENEETDFPLNMYKPLAAVRREQEYYFSMSERRGRHDPEDDNWFTVMLLPELWQALPEARRPLHLADCTCILMNNMTYESIGFYYAKISQNMLGINNITNTIEYKTPIVLPQSFPLYNAKMELFLLSYPDKRKMIIDTRINSPKYQPDSKSDGVLITGSFTLTYKTTTLGLSGQFDSGWIRNYYAPLIKMERK